jgi:hypothetical protein
VQETMLGHLRTIILLAIIQKVLVDVEKIASLQFQQHFGIDEGHLN